MLNNFLSIETLSRGLFMQQLNQDVTASNLAKTYYDSDGYLITSRQRLDIMEASPLLFGSMGGVRAVGTGPMVQQITRLRSSFLDTQIQRESSILGRSEILANILPQINTIINGSAGTLDNSLTNLASAFTALAANPLDIGLRSDAVSDAVAFSELARNQYNGLQQLQYGMDRQIQQTLTDINQILQQLSQYNSALLNSNGATLNDVLDARDYALDRLSRLVSVQSNIRGNGTLDIQLQGSGLALLDASGASILQSNVMNRHNAGLVSVNIQSSQGSLSMIDAAQFIKGGRLAGMLEARDVLLESYKTQIDQVATSVLQVVNNFHRSGYAADGVTTGTSFFTGTGAADISVNASIVGDPTRALLAASSRQGVTANGQIAQFIGNVKNHLANNFIQTRPTIGPAGINPNLPIASQPLTTTGTAGSFTVNGVPVVWTSADSVYSLLDKINAADPNVNAVYNATERRVYIYSNNPINIISTSGFAGAVDITKVLSMSNILISSIKVNNGFAPTDSAVVFFDPNPPADDLNSTIPGTPLIPGLLPNGPNSQAFRVTPGAQGSFTVNGNTVAWANTDSLQQILARISATVSPGTVISATFDQNPTSPTYQMVIVASSGEPRPIQITDLSGNFTVFTGLNANTPIGNISAGVLGRISSETSAQQLTMAQSRAALDQLNTAQANIGGLSTIAGEPGVPIQVEQENAIKSLIAYNASLQVMAVINQMYADLINIVGGSTTGSTLNQRI